MSTTQSGEQGRWSAAAVNRGEGVVLRVIDEDSLGLAGDASEPKYGGSGPL